jgi:hypothetical protein
MYLAVSTGLLTVEKTLPFWAGSIGWRILMTDIAPFERVVYNGALMDQKTKAFVQAMEAKLDYPLTILQGCYNPGGVKPSGGTHDLGGVIDLVPWDFENKVKVARELGAFAWHRLPIPKVWGEHIHLGIRNQGNLSSEAQTQQVDFDGTPGRDGLAGHAVDPNKFHPDPSVTFAFPQPHKARPLRTTRVQQARSEIARAMQALSEAAALLDDTDPKRVRARAQIDQLKTTETDLASVMDALPKK